MGSPIENKNAAVAFPTATNYALQPGGKRGVEFLATSATAASFAVPAAWKGNFLRFKLHANGVSNLYCRVALSFRATAETLVINQTTTPGTGHVASGARLNDGEMVDGIVPHDATFLEWVSSATGGYVEFWCSEIGVIAKGT